MQLKPSEPPGHARRKLRGLVSEIARLRSEGYTIRAIRQALEDAGIRVGWATVQREVARLAPASPAAAAPRARQPVPRPTPSAPTAPAAARPSPAAADDVDRFFDQRNSNPLFRKKGHQP